MTNGSSGFEHAEITPEMELEILRELQALGVLVTCESCGKCDLAGAHCVTTRRGNGICGKLLMPRESEGI